jgi:hypothetical protein
MSFTLKPVFIKLLGCVTVVSSLWFCAILIDSEWREPSFRDVPSDELWIKFDYFVRQADDYSAAVAMKELCNRNYSVNMYQYGSLLLNCDLVQTEDPRNVEFMRGSIDDPPIDFTGVAQRRNNR